MSTSIHIDGSLSALTDALSGTGYFDTVVYTPDSTGPGTIRCTKGSLVFQIGIMSTGRNGYSISLSNGLATGQRITSDILSDTDYKPIDMYVCSGGISIVCQRGRIAIGKTVNGDTAVAFGSGISGSGDTDTKKRTATSMSTLYSIAESDGPDINNFWNNTSGNVAERLYKQTYLIPMPTLGSHEKASYLPKIMLVWLPQTRDICNFTYNDKRYFSDGYFAIEDPLE